MKQAVRQSIIALRAAMPPHERMKLSRLVLEKMVGLPAYQSAQTVLGYLSFGAELDTGPWLSRAQSAGKRILLPRVNPASRHLDIYEVQDLEKDVAPGHRGIREPVVTRCRRVEGFGELDFILLPGVAFTRSGARLGYGGGYYDRLLAGLPGHPVLVAGAFSIQVVDELPLEPTDRPVHYLVTEHETTCCI